MYWGIDLGSRYVKIVLAGTAEIEGFYRYDTIDFYKQYGRNTVKVMSGEDIPEIKAHALGAIWQTGLQNFTLLDLGGQDSKVVLVKEGKVIDFQTNDRCAAGSGRYLENMAGVLGLGLDELSQHRDNPVDLNATCAIFGESELIGKIIEGSPVEELAAGVNYTIYKRIKPLLAKLHSPPLMSLIMRMCKCKREVFV
jgi:predicted CoA-substrate-specific enzyme activase